MHLYDIIDDLMNKLIFKTSNKHNANLPMLLRPHQTQILYCNHADYREYTLVFSISNLSSKQNEAVLRNTLNLFFFNLINNYNKKSRF